MLTEAPRNVLCIPGAKASRPCVLCIHFDSPAEPSVYARKENPAYLGLQKLLHQLFEPQLHEIALVN